MYARAYARIYAHSLSSRTDKCLVSRIPIGSFKYKVIHVINDAYITKKRLKQQQHKINQTKTNTSQRNYHRQSLILWYYHQLSNIVVPPAQTPYCATLSLKIILWYYCHLNISVLPSPSKIYCCATITWSKFWYYHDIKHIVVLPPPPKPYFDSATTT